MKKIISILTIASLTCSMLVGCGSGAKKNKDGVQVNDTYSTKKMVTAGGEEIRLVDIEYILGDIKEYGFVSLAPKSWANINFDQLDFMQTENATYVGYVPSAVLEEYESKDFDAMSEAEQKDFFDYMYGQVFDFLCIYAVDDENLDIGMINQIKQDYEKTEEITTNDGFDYYISYNTTIPKINLSDEDRTNLQTMIDSIAEIKDNMVFFPATADDVFTGNLSQFTAEDMEGNTVNQEIFSQYDLTMVNVWTTWCGFCIDEMPELEKLHQQLPENVNIISICGDAKDDKELAEKILKESGITFQTLVANDEIEEKLMQYISGFPTTLFLDSKGNVVGEIQVGAPGEDIVEGYNQLIQDRLSMIGGN